MLVKLLRIAAFSAATTLPAVALAQAPPAPPPGGGHGDSDKVREACRADADRLCKGVKPGGGRIRECFKAHQAELSDGCKAAIKDAREHHHAKG
jgi:hypothetical protein